MGGTCSATAARSCGAETGIYHDQPLIGIFLQNAFVNPPFVANPQVTNAQLSNPGAGASPTARPVVNLIASSDPFETPRVQQWNVGVQRQLYPRGMVDVGYVGSAGDNLIQPVGINLPQPPDVVAVNGVVNVARPYRGYGVVNSRQTTARSRDNGLLMSFRHDHGRAGLLSVAYTLSRTGMGGPGRSGRPGDDLLKTLKAWTRVRLAGARQEPRAPGHPQAPPGWETLPIGPRVGSESEADMEPGRMASPLAVLAAGAALLLMATSMSSCAKPARPAVVPEAVAVPGLVPWPASIAVDPSRTFTVSEQTRILVEPADEDTVRIGRLLADLIGPAPNAVPAVLPAAGTIPPAGIHLAIRPDASLGAEGYELEIAPERVTLVAPTAAGLFYGVQTFRQLLPPIVEHEAARRGRDPMRVPAARIRDVPRFPWRGAMLDVARHFFGPADVRRYIDLLALYKINRLHLHLSDDQGWRIDIRSWPNLARHGGSTEVAGGPGGFYSQDEYAALVSYAADRFMTVVPEIDMPGHTNAALASYPELNCDGVAPPLYTGIEVGFSALCVDREQTYAFLDDVIREIAALTPGPYFHIGGDEVKTLSVDEYRRFIERVQGIVHLHGKRMIGWDEVAAASLASTSIVQHWRPSAPPALIAGAPAVILSPGNRTYLDMKYDDTTLLGLTWAGLIGVRDAYDWDPASLVPALPPERILGIEAPLWSETLAHIQDVEFMAFPRLAALAEVAWSPQSARTWDAFERRLAAQGPRWTALGVNFHRAPAVRWPH